MLLLSENSIHAHAKSHKHRKQGKAGLPTAWKDGSRASALPLDQSGRELLDADTTPSITKSNTFNVRSYAAKGDGVTDDTNVSLRVYCARVIFS